MSNVSFLDTDSSIVFSGAWSGNAVLTNPVTGPPVDYRFANDLTAQFAFTFPKPATAFYYFGFQRSKGGHYLACVDCDPQNPQFTDIDALNVNDDGRHPPVVLFSKTFSSPGIHTVIVRNTNDDRFDASQITITSLVLTIPSGNPPATSSPSPQPPAASQQESPTQPAPASQSNPASVAINPQPSSQNSAIFSANAPSGVSSSPITSASQSSSSDSQAGSADSSLTNSTPTDKSSSHAGAIAGGVVGGIAALAAVLILLWFFRRHRGRGPGASREPFNFPPDMRQTGHRGFQQTAGHVAGGAVGAEGGSPVYGQYPSQAAFQSGYPAQQPYPMQSPHAQQFQPQQYQSYPAAATYPGPAVDQAQGRGQAYHAGGVHPVALPVAAASEAAGGAFTYTTTATSSSSGASESISPTSEHGRTPSDSAITTSSNGRVYGTGEVKNAHLFHQTSVSTTTTASTGRNGSNAPVRRAVQNQEVISPTWTDIRVETPVERSLSIVPPAYDQLFTGASRVAPVH